MLNQKLSLWMIGILLSIITIVPFAIPFAYFPISKFYSESTSLIAGFGIFAVAVFSRQQLKFSPVAIACFAFAIFALIQPFFVHIYFLGNNYYVAILFFILGLVALGITSFVDGEEFSNARQKIILVICWTLVMSAALQAIIAYLQYTGKAINYSDYVLVSAEQVTDG
ncbi:MAG: hypothetical protein RLZZ293_820, partial [Pseudomonadota bacterium]